jgi:hypothetical protein
LAQVVALEQVIKFVGLDMIIFVKPAVLEPQGQTVELTYLGREE